MQQDRYLTELSKCVRCGSCKAICPTYDQNPSEAMGTRGRLSLLLALSSGQIKPSPTLNERIFSCTLCGACAGRCPLAVDVGEVILHGRSLLRKIDRKRRLLRLIVNFAVGRPQLCFRVFRSTQHLLLPHVQKTGLLPFKLELPEYTLRDNIHVITVPRKKGRVAVFTGCMVNFIYPNLGESLINVLHYLGYEVVLPSGEVCCGAPLRALGLEKEAVELAKKNIGIFGRLNVEAILSLCPTCTLALKVEYPKLIGERIDKVTDVESFLADKIDVTNSEGSASSPGSAFYHDPCHLRYGLGIEKEPRRIMRSLGIDVVETRGEKCCGFAGVFCISHKELSGKLLRNCAEDYGGTGAEAIITSCPGCLMQLSKAVSDKPVLHLIEAVEEAILPRETTDN
jgi:glycolate oxidase iron-sulfur subunit